mmetsp:Transcript_34522/g.45634  ORF Transcript_34522/g.45634 Transcript_34522/m.45634 type:complete len:300 (-) Transcript_34522:1591-2490(-)
MFCRFFRVINSLRCGCNFLAFYIFFIPLYSWAQAVFIGNYSGVRIMVIRFRVLFIYFMRSFSLFLSALFGQTLGRQQLNLYWSRRRGVGVPQFIGTTGRRPTALEAPPASCTASTPPASTASSSTADMATRWSWGQERRGAWERWSRWRWVWVWVKPCIKRLYGRRRRRELMLSVLHLKLALIVVPKIIEDTGVGLEFRKDPQDLDPLRLRNFLGIPAIGYRLVLVVGKGDMPELSVWNILCINPLHLKLTLPFILGPCPKFLAIINSTLHLCHSTELTTGIHAIKEVDGSFCRLEGLV